MLFRCVAHSHGKERSGGGQEQCTPACVQGKAGLLKGLLSEHGECPTLAVSKVSHKAAVGDECVKDMMRVVVPKKGRRDERDVGLRPVRLGQRHICGCDRPLYHKVGIMNQAKDGHQSAVRHKRVYSALGTCLHVQAAWLNSGEGRPQRAMQELTPARLRWAA